MQFISLISGMRAEIVSYIQVTRALTQDTTVNTKTVSKATSINSVGSISPVYFSRSHSDRGEGSWSDGECVSGEKEEGVV